MFIPTKHLSKVFQSGETSDLPVLFSYSKYMEVLKIIPMIPNIFARTFDSSTQTALKPDLYQIYTRFIPDLYQIYSRFIPDWC